MNDTIGKKGEFDIITYSKNLNDQISYINKKIVEYEIKLTSLKSKENIIDTMINRSNEQVEKYTKEKNFKVAGIHQSYILTQFETLGQVQEMLIRYEDMIQKSVKSLIDIENHKFNTYSKLKTANKQEKSTDEDYEKLMTAMHKMVTTPTDDNPMIDVVREQLKLEGY